MSAPARLTTPLAPLTIGAAWTQPFALYGADENDLRDPEGLELWLYRRDRRALAAGEILSLTSADGEIVITGNVGVASLDQLATAALVAGQYEFQLFEIVDDARLCRLVGTIAFEAGPVVAEAGDVPGPPLSGASGALVSLYGTETIRVVLGPGGMPGPAGPQGPVDICVFANGTYGQNEIVFAVELLTDFTMDPDRYSIRFGGVAGAERVFNFINNGTEAGGAVTGGTLVAVATVANGAGLATLDFITTDWLEGSLHCVALGPLDTGLANGRFSFSGVRAS